MKENRKIAIKIIDLFESLLNRKNIIIPNEDRENSKDETAIYGGDYYELEDAVTEILNQYIYNKNVYEKLKTWIKYIKSEKDVSKVISKFEDLFDNEFNPIFVQSVGKYFESYSEIYELNGNISVEKSWGAWDKIEGKVSHVGIEINIYFRKSKKKKNRKGIALYFQSEYQNNIEELEKMLEEEMKSEIDV